MVQWGTMNTSGYKTKTFWFVLAANILAVLYALGYSPDAVDAGLVAKGVGLVTAVLMSAGYAVVRNYKKIGDPAKPFYTRTEFWLTVAAVLVASLLTSNVFPVEATSFKVATTIASILAVLGYRPPGVGVPR